MLYSIKKFWVLVVLMIAATPGAFGYTMIGPFESWQVAPNGFNLVGDDGGPKDLGDGFRWNTKTLYYACDASFADFFGTNGIAEIDKAFAVFNNLTNLSSYSSNLTEWPLQTSRINGTAEALDLQDVKSWCMSKIINMLGLSQPQRYVWDIHNRVLIPGTTCPFGETYIVVQRNFDPATYVYSSYVNGVLFDYFINETCTGPNPLAVSQTFSVDPDAPFATTVADGVDALYGFAITWPGRYFTGLTRDDVGGMRYLMATNRINRETVAPGVVQLITSPSPEIVATSNLSVFYAQALTNAPGALTAIYPNLIITSVSNSFMNVVTTNFIAVTVPVQGGLAGTFQTVIEPVLTTNVQEIFFYTFGNLIIFTNSPQSFITTATTTVTPNRGALAGTFTITTNFSTVSVPGTNGAFYILPTNACGGFTNITVQLITVNAITNPVPITFVNGITNSLGLTNFGVSIITYFTNFTLVAQEIDCITNTASLREGIDKINFQRVDFDSILGVTWGPVTNNFSLTAVSNSAPVVQNFQRIVTQPDITIEAKDGIIGPATLAPILEQFPALLNFNATVESSDGNGPGTIEPPTTFIFTKGGGPIFFNGGGFFQDQATAIAQGGVYWQWGTFDGSTNTPIIYPDSSSLAGLETLVFFQISTPVLPPYSVSTNSAANLYSTTLQVSGGSLPFTWSLVTGSPALPPGLSLSSTTGVISGVTTASAGQTFDFIVQVQDGGQRVTQADLSITTTP